MRAPCFVTVAASVALVLVPALVFGQRATTGTVTGRVVDSSGGVLPGVNVTLSSPDVLGQFTSVTDTGGLYRVANLPPAVYHVRAELAGFQAVIREATVHVSRSEEHTSELQSRGHLVCRLLLEKK